MLKTLRFFDIFVETYFFSGNFDEHKFQKNNIYMKYTYFVTL